MTDDNFDPAEDYDDKKTWPLIVELSPRRRGCYITDIARDLVMQSVSNAGGPPRLSMKEAFDIAEQFVAEGAARGY